MVDAGENSPLFETPNKTSNMATRELNVDSSIDILTLSDMEEWLTGNMAFTYHTPDYGHSRWPNWEKAIPTDYRKNRKQEDIGIEDSYDAGVHGDTLPGPISFPFDSSREVLLPSFSKRSFKRAADEDAWSSKTTLEHMTDWLQSVPQKVPTGTPQVQDQTVGNEIEEATSTNAKTLPDAWASISKEIGKLVSPLKRLHEIPKLVGAQPNDLEFLSTAGSERTKTVTGHLAPLQPSNIVYGSLSQGFDENKSGCLHEDIRPVHAGEGTKILWPEVPLNFDKGHSDSQAMSNFEFNPRLKADRTHTLPADSAEKLNTTATSNGRSVLSVPCVELSNKRFISKRQTPYFKRPNERYHILRQAHRSRGCCMMLIDITATAVSTSCAWAIRQYDRSLGLQGTTNELQWLVDTTGGRGLSKGSMVQLTKLSDNPLLPVLAIGLLYAASVSVTYCLRRHDKYLDQFLCLATGATIITGLLQGTGVQATVVQLVPGAIALSLLFSAIFHYLFVAEIDQGECGPEFA